MNMRPMGWLVLVTSLAACSTISQLPWPFRAAQPQQEPAATPQQEEGATPRALRREKIAIATAQVPLTVDFRAPERVESEAPRIMQESITAGAAIGGIPLLACAATYSCPPDALLAGTALLLAGTAAGILVGVGRVLARGKFTPPPQPPALSRDEIEASAAAIHAAVAEFIGQPALHQCLLRKLVPGGEAHSVQWSHEQRVVSFAAVTGIGSASRSQSDAYTGLVHDGYQYVIESFISGIAMAPAGAPGQESSEVPARLVVEGGFRFFDLDPAREHEQKVEWRSELHPLRDRRADDGALLDATLRTGCDALAAQIATEAERIWRSR